MDLEDVEYQLSKAKLLGSKGTTGTQASFLELFDGDHEKCKELDRKIAKFRVYFRECMETAALLRERHGDAA